ncbi:MAG: hypothetical protein FWG35_00365, partial [Spirochaetaceae bacterium]|nr:hypothetical protein [Spirochaetaceae bacterium]
EKEWVSAKPRADDDAHILRELYRGDPKYAKAAQQSPEDIGSLDVSLAVTFTNYEWPFAGTTLGLGLAYNWEIIPGLLVPGLGLSADLDPKTFWKIVELIYMLASDSSSDDEKDDKKDEDEDSPERGNFTVKIFNEIKLGTLSLRPFFGFTFLSYSYHELSVAAFCWITGAEIIYMDAGIEFAYMIADNDSDRRSGKKWFRVALTYHL